MNPKKNLEQLFISKVRIKALKYFLSKPNEAIHLRAAVRELDEEINAVRRELSRLEGIKFLLSERKGNRKYFKMNLDFVFLDELQAIIFKTFGLGGEIIKNSNKLGEVSFAAITRSFLNGENPEGLDLIVVGDNLDMQLLDTLVTAEEKGLSRHINYTVLSSRDFELHKRRRDNFIIQILSQDRIMLIGRSQDFAAS
jgi:DNA-binding transcriptional ArsR family regulator